MVSLNSPSFSQVSADSRGTGKFEVKSKTGAVGAVCICGVSAEPPSPSVGMSSSPYFVLCSKLCCQTCFFLFRPTFQRLLVMSYDDLYCFEDT